MRVRPNRRALDASTYLRSLFVRRKKFLCVGYNFLIGPSGRIYEGRNLAYDGAHVRSHNAGNIGIAMLGDYSDRQLTKEQLESLKALMKDLQTRYAIDEVKTHGDFDPGKSDELKGARSQITPLLR